MPTLSWTGARFEVRCKAVDKEIFKEAGFHYDWKNQLWWTGLTEIAKKFEQFADPSAKTKLNKHKNEIAASMAIDSNFQIPVPSGLSYLNFQRAGIEYAVQRFNTLIADDMGLGKTIQGIGIINTVPWIKKILIVCPAGLSINWAKELVKWCTKKLVCDFATGSYFPADANVIIVSYETMSKIKSKVLAIDWDLHLYDEAHMIKNPLAKRTQAIVGIEHENRTGRHTTDEIRAIEAKMKVFLTGTPILNRPVELWPMLRMLDPEGLGANFWLFARRFCGMEESDMGRDFSGASNLDVLQERMRANFMIRRLKKDVLKELPPKRRQVIELPGDAAKKVVQAELNFYNNNVQLVEQAVIQAEIEQKAGDTTSYNATVKDLKGLRQIMFEEISKLRHDTAVAKVPYAIPYLENVLEQEDKLVVFAHHIDVINPIFEKFADIAVKYDGSMSMTAKNRSVERFQEDPKVKLFIGSITAAGVGITLTKASTAIFLELDWRPAMVTQAEDRLHRIGQLYSVLIQHIVFNNSLDANMAKKIIKKQEIIDAAIG